MKAIFWIWLLLIVAAPCRAAATFFITSELEGDVNAPWFIPPDEDGENGVRYRGDTIDYLRFRVAMTTSVTITTRPSQLQWLFGQYIGREDVFAAAGFSTVFRPHCLPFLCTPDLTNEWRTFDITLHPGDYVVSTSFARYNDEYTNEVSLGQGYRAANPGGGGFYRNPYSYNISGEIAPVNFWHGHIDRTWTKSYYIPEPGSAALLAGTGALLLLRKRMSGAGVDYHIVNTYAHNTAHNTDWPVTGARWRMITWDAEFCLREGTVGTDPLIGITGSALRVDGGIATFHRRLRNYQPYRDAFRARMDIHFKTATGVLSLTGAVHNASTLFQQAQNRFLPVLFSESARWGYMDTGSGAPFTRDAGLPITAISGDWTAATRYVRENWLVNRRTPYLNAMQAAGLYTP